MVSARLASSLAVTALALFLSSCDSKSTGNAGPFFIDAGPRDIATDTGGAGDVAADTASPPDGGASDAPAADAPAMDAMDAPAGDAPSGDAPADTANPDTGTPTDAANPDLPRVDALDALPGVDLGAADTRDATGG